MKLKKFLRRLIGSDCSGIVLKKKEVIIHDHLDDKPEDNPFNHS